MKTLYYIPNRARQIILALADALVSEPSELTISNKDNELIGRCETLLREFVPLTRFFFILGIYIFDWLPPILGFGMRRFINLRTDQKKNFVGYWLVTKNAMMREFFKGIRGLVMICYFSHQDIWNYIGYFPKKHVEDRIRLRQELLEKRIRESGS